VRGYDATVAKRVRKYEVEPKPAERPAPPPPSDPRQLWIDQMRQFRGRRERDVSIDASLIGMEREFRDRQNALGDIIDAWNELAPAAVRDAATISGLAQGTLTLTVASSSASYELSRVLRDSLERTLMQRFPARIRRVKVRVGGEA
jgi:hypothetical protein